jgi:Rrf2 family protein
MKLSTRSTYGLRALVELALAAGHGPVSASVIAARQALSVAYLEQLLHRLKNEGFVRSIRGPRGGYLLARAPGQIAVGGVVRVLDGDPGGRDGRALDATGASRRRGRPRRPGANGAHARPGPGREAARRGERTAQAVWRCVHERIAQSLDAVTLQDVCDEVRASAGEAPDHRYVFHI